MAVLVITRFILAKSWHSVPFLAASTKASKQAARALGYLDGAVLKDKERVYWTISLWEDAGTMKAYRDSGDHKDLMPKAQKWAASMAAATLDWDGDLPDWDEAGRLLELNARLIDTPHTGNLTRQERVAPPERTRFSMPIPSKRR